MRLPLSLAFAFVASPVAAQQVLWVDPLLGSNGNPGTFQAPLQTITAAVAVAGPAAQIHLLPGTYGPTSNGEVLPITLGQIPQAGLVLRGIGDVTLDLATSAATAFRLANGADGCRLTNLTITNSDRTGWWTRAISSGTGTGSGNAATGVEIDRCRFTHLNRGLVLWAADNVQGWRVHDNLFDDCANDAILEYAGNNEFTNNTFVTGAWKAYISDSPTSLCANNLVVAYNIAFEVNSTAGSTARFQHNWTWQCTTVASGAGLAGGLPASHVDGVNPQLVNQAGGDYHPQPTSPLLEAGTPAVFTRADLDGVARLVDSDANGSLLPDVGCYEHTPVTLSAAWLTPNQVLSIGLASTVANTFGFVFFAFDDGLIQIPGWGPILLDPLTAQGFYLAGLLPQQWFLVFTGVAVPPGTRLVMHGLSLVPGTPHVVGSNQVWFQL
ncbi:MAG: DUF1565 domain-containing protein [Pirellulales bacterium]